MEYPEFLFRASDGERLKHNGDGTYSFIRTLMKPSYKYNFADLVNMGGFKIETEDKEVLLDDGLPLRELNGLTIVRGKEDYEEFYYYRDSSHIKSRKPKKYPREYPCVVKMENEDAGIMGDYMQHYVSYFPRGHSPDNVKSNYAYLLGLSGKWETL